MRLRRAALALAVDVLAVAVLAAAALWMTLAPLWRQRPGQMAPTPAITLLDGRRVDLAHWRGQPVLVDFWAPDCAPCVAALPQLQALAQRTRGRAHVLGVAVAWSDPAAVRAVAARAGITYDLAWDRDGRIAQAFGGVRATPTQILIAADGRIAARDEGGLGAQLLQRALTAGATR